MDRELSVIKDGSLLAEYSFRYTGQVAGKATVTIYGTTQLEDGLTITSPVSKYEADVHHPQELKTIEEIKVFDKSFVKDDPSLSESLAGNIEFAYKAMHYRYLLMAGDNTMGIADIHTGFNEDKKELLFISATRVRSDHSLSSGSVEGNITLLKRLGQIKWPGFLSAEYKEAQGSHT